MDDKKIIRVPVTPDYIMKLLTKLFDDCPEFVVYFMAKNFLNKVQDNELRQNLEEVIERCKAYVGKPPSDESEGKTKKSSPENKKRKFIVLFKKGFLERYGYKYNQSVQPKHIKILMLLISKLDKNSVSIEEFLDWFFKHFLKDEKNKRFHPAGIGLASSNWILDESLYYIKKEQVTEKVETNRQAEKDALIKRAAELLTRFPKDRELKQEIKSYKIGRYDNVGFRRFLTGKSRDLNKKR